MTNLAINTDKQMGKKSASGRPTYATIDLSAIQFNYAQMANKAGHSKTIAVIKADAYGHGAKQVAGALNGIVDAFAVAFIDEAIVLREAGIKQPILLLEGVMHAHELVLAQRYNFWVMLHSDYQIEWLTTLEQQQRPIIWLKIDTGMHRLGLTVEALEYCLSNYPTLLQSTSVLCSHLACADETDNAFNLQQIAQLKQLANHYCLPISLANSAGIDNWPASHGDWNRVGIALYGYAQPHNSQANLRVAMRLHAPIIALKTIKKGESVGYGRSWIAQKDQLIATVAIGYADGYPRHAAAGTPAFLHTQTIYLVGRVSMDMLTFDVSQVNEVQIGDQVELWGDNVSVERVAAHAGTIAYELLSRLSPRVTRIWR